MSGRMRKQSDCPVAKQGPMRATLPVSSVMKQKKNAGNSPTLSPTNAWRRISPDHALSGQRSPGAVNYKGKGRFGANTIRRTASLDNLYHKGQWSRDYYLHAGQLQIDKSTQTDDGSGTSGRSSRGSDDDKLDRFLRSRLQRPHKSCGSGDSSSHSMSTALCTIPNHTADCNCTLHVQRLRAVDRSGAAACMYFYEINSERRDNKGSRFGSGGVPLRAARSSVEGLNQEIERLVLYPASGTQTPHLDRLRDKVTPEGHRAPLAELLRRSVNTQTPHDLSHTAHSSGGSVCSSPDLDGSRLGTSPQINRFLAREPPDGCEKVNLKAGDGLHTEQVTTVKPTIPGFTLRPSQGSAFQPLQPAHHLHSPPFHSPPFHTPPPASPTSRNSPISPH